MIKVLGLALYGSLAASNRYRLGQYVHGLAEHEISLEVFPLLGNGYLRERLAKDSTLPLSHILKAGANRLIDLMRQYSYDIAILQCELLPFMPGFLERALIRRPYIYDFDDAFYLKYRSNRMCMVRSLLGQKFDTVISGAAAVTSGSNLLFKYANSLNENTFYLPTVVDTSRYFSSPLLRGNTVFTVGWIGSPSTAPFLSELINPLSDLGRESPVKFIVIGGRAPIIPNVEVIELVWREDLEIDLINSFDIGVMPLPNDDWAKGKCAFKLIQYMACGVPVVASPVGANIDVVSRDSGFLAESPSEWLNYMRLLRDNPQLRTAMGCSGRRRIEESYSLEKNLPKLAKVIQNVAGRN